GHLDVYVIAAPLVRGWCDRDHRGRLVDFHREGERRAAVSVIVHGREGNRRLAFGADYQLDWATGDGSRSDRLRACRAIGNLLEAGAFGIIGDELGVNILIEPSSAIRRGI